jgi:4,4'-diaponeurosporenoate glycosyltransferase
MFDKNLYFSFGGHELVKQEVVEDFVLGQLLRKKDINCELFLGLDDVSYRMYPNSFSELFWGWSKNFATGAISSPFWILSLVILWVGSYFAISTYTIKNIYYFAQGNINLSSLMISIFIYFSSCFLLYLKAKKTGSFSFWAYICYIIPLFMFGFIFLFSLILKFVFKKVKWKGVWYKA